MLFANYGIVNPIQPAILYIASSEVWTCYINKTIGQKDLDRVQEIVIAKTASEAVKKLVKNGTQVFWIHLDVYVLNDKDMPAVDYRLSGRIAYEDVKCYIIFY